MGDGTQALREAAKCLRRCLDKWPPTCTHIASPPDAPPEIQPADSYVAAQKGICFDSQVRVSDSLGTDLSFLRNQCEDAPVADLSCDKLGVHPTTAATSTAAATTVNSDGCRGLLALACQELAQAQYLQVGIFRGAAP